MRERPVHWGSLVAVLLCTALASVSEAVLPACAEPAPVGQAVDSPPASAPGAPGGRGHPLEACRPSIA